MRINPLIAAATLLAFLAPVLAANSLMTSIEKESAPVSSTHSKTDEVKAAIDALIQTATTYDVEALERIYHDDLHVTMVDAQNNVNHADKATFKGLFASKRDAGDPPMNTWAKYHHIDVKDDAATILLSRKNNLNGADMDIFLTIDLKHEDGRWQVTREIIFLRPEIS